MTSIKKISELKIGDKAIVDSFIEESAFSLRLKEMGLLPGVIVEFIRRGDPLIIKIKGTFLSLSLNQAKFVSVRLNGI